MQRARSSRPDSVTAMRDLIAEIRRTLPFDKPEAQICTDPCRGCSIKLLDYLLVLAILGGLAVPVVHISLGRIVRRQSRKSNQE